MQVSRRKQLNTQEIRIHKGYEIFKGQDSVMENKIQSG